MKQAAASVSSSLSLSNDETEKNLLDENCDDAAIKDANPTDESIQIIEDARCSTVTFDRLRVESDSCQELNLGQMTARELES